jgi:uncharacterized membrane protein
MTPIPTIRSSRPVLNAATADFQLTLNIRGKSHSHAQVEEDKAKSSMDSLISKYHLHPIIDHFTIALLATGVLADVVGYIIGLLFPNGSPRVKGLADRLSGAALVLLIPGAISAIFSRITGESEAERVWDTISPAAQQILFSDTGSARFLSHAVLGTYLMYAFVALVAWRVLLEIWTEFKRTQLTYLMVAIVALCALLYQGKTGGELVYDHAVGSSHASTTAAIDSQ